MVSQVMAFKFYFYLFIEPLHLSEKNVQFCEFDRLFDLLKYSVWIGKNKKEKIPTARVFSYQGVCL